MARKEPEECLFCHRSEDDELKYGKLYSNKSGTAHYYCLLFSSGLEQRGKESDGIIGFLEADLIKEKRRGSKLRCFKCKRSGATVGCCKKTCKKTFHFPCGIEKEMLNQFCGTFNSYCIQHRPVQEVPVESNEQNATCAVCLEDVVAKPSLDTLWAPCCKKQSWFHRGCLQNLALSAGYFFKCPICSDNILFCEEMKKFGVHIPQQDASWELEPNAFQELAERHNSCDNHTCICPKGRQYDCNDGTRWDIVLCSSCGSKGVHIGCGKLNRNIMEWNCDDCSSHPSNSFPVIPVENVDASRSRSAMGIRSNEFINSSDDSDDSDIELLVVIGDFGHLASKRRRGNQYDGLFNAQPVNSAVSDDSDIEIVLVIDPKSPTQMASQSTSTITSR